MIRVLVVDNNEAELSKLERVLVAGNFKVAATWSGREALGLLSTQAFDAMILDDYLPDMHVNNFLGMVAKLPVKPFIVVLMNEPTLKDEKKFQELNVSKVADKRLINSIPQTIALILERGCKAESEIPPKSHTIPNPDSL